jgi:uncharacterized protein (DUF2147 family)
VVLSIARCGPDHCGTVVWAAPKAILAAKKGGTPSLVGAQLVRGLKPQGNGVYRGRAFEPKHGVSAVATVRVISHAELEVRGCAFAGMLCKDQRWNRMP